MHWFGGSITAAITTAKQRNVLFVVYVRGDNDASIQMDTTWEDHRISQMCEDSGMVAVKFNSDSDEYKQFSQYYPVKGAPCVSFISGATGEPLETADGYINSSDFKQKIQRVLLLEGTKQASTGQSLTQAAASTSGPATMVTDSSINPQPAPLTQASTITTQAPASTALQASADSPDQKKELSKLEKAARLRQKMEEIHQRKEAEKEEELKRKEMERRVVGQAVQKSRQQQSEQEARQAAQELRKEKEEDRLARERIREQIARDRAEKQSRYENDKQEREKRQAAASEAAQVASEAPKKKVNMLKGRSHMKTSKRSHRFHKGKVYICPHCLKEYHAKGSLRRHLRIEHGPRVFSWCQRCEYQCNRRDNLKRHYLQYHTQYVGDLETIALETVEQRQRRVGFDSAERRLATSKVKGSQKRKTGKKTRNASKRSRRDSRATASCLNLIGNEHTQSGRMCQPSLIKDSQENAGGTHQHVQWAAVKMEPRELLVLPSSPLPPTSSSSSSGLAAQYPVSSPVWNDMADQLQNYWTGYLYQCPQCIMTFQHCSSLFQHIQKEHREMPLFFCQYCSFRCKGKDNLRKHYYKLHPLHQGEVDVMASESISQTEISEHQDALVTVEAVADHEQGSSQSLLRGHNSSSSYLNLTQLEGSSGGLCPDASTIHGHSEQTADAIMPSCSDGLSVLHVGGPLLLQDSSLPKEQTTKGSCLTISSQELLSTVSHVFPNGEEDFSNSSSSQPVYDSDTGMHMTCSSEPVHHLGDVHHQMEWAVPQGKEAGGFLKCPKCCREYIQLGSLSRHLRLDHGPPTFFWCRHCEFRTNRKDNFKRHYKQSHLQHFGEVTAINVETSEEKENRERQEEMKKTRPTQRSGMSQTGSGHGVRDAGRDEMHLQRLEPVSTSSVVKRTEKHQISQTHDSCLVRAILQPLSSKSSALSPSMRSVKIVHPNRTKTLTDSSPTCIEHAESERTNEVFNSPQSRPSDTQIPQDPHNSLPAMRSNATPNVPSVRRSKRKSSHHIACDLAKVFLPVSHDKLAQDHVKAIANQEQEQETSNNQFGLINSLQEKVTDGEDIPTCSSLHRYTCIGNNASHFLVKPKQIIVSGNAKPESQNSNKDNVAHNSIQCVQRSHLPQRNATTVVRSPHTNMCINLERRIDPLIPPTSNTTKTTARDSPNVEQSAPSLPQINIPHTGYESPTSCINVTNNVVPYLHNSQPSQSLYNYNPCINSPTTQQPNAACAVPGLMDCAQARPNNAAQEESPVTSTSEGTCVSLTRLEEVLRGNVTKVIEESHTVTYKDGTRIKEETVKRTYEVVFQADFGNGTVKPCQ